MVTPQEAAQVTAVLDVTDLNVSFETEDIRVPAVRARATTSIRAKWSRSSANPVAAKQPRP